MKTNHQPCRVPSDTRRLKALNSHTSQYGACGASQTQLNKTDSTLRLPRNLFIQLEIESHCLRTSPEHSLGNGRIGRGLMCGGGTKPLKKLAGVCSNT